VTQIAMMRNRVCYAHLMMAKFQNPLSGMDPSNVWRHHRTASGALAYTQSYDVANTDFRHDAVGGGVGFLATLGVVSAALGRRDGGRVVHGLEGGHLQTPITVVSDTASLTGEWGKLFDTYYAPDNLTTGILMQDAAGDVQWVNVDDMWLPWSNAAGQMRID